MCYLSFFLADTSLSHTPKGDMQPVRRSSRLRSSVASSSGNQSSSEPPATRTNSCKQARRRTRCTPPPEPSEEEVESLSETNASDEDSGDSDASMEEKFFPQETRYEASRATFQALYQANPQLLRPTKPPRSARFATSAALARYRDLKEGKFVDHQSLTLTDEKLADIKKVILHSGLIYTVIDADAYQPAVVREFIANIPDAVKRGDGLGVYVCGSLVDFSPELINTMYCIPEVAEDPDWLHEDIDKVCSFLSGEQVNRWECMASKYLTLTNQVLYKLVCSNWLPTMNCTSMNQERLRFIYMMYHHRGFNFGKIAYNQILTMAGKTDKDKKRRIIFPTLIQQVLLFQRVVPPDDHDEEETGFPKTVVKDG